MKLSLLVTGLSLLGLAVSLGCGKDDEANPVAPRINNPPEIMEQSDTVATLGDTLKLQAVASDEDGDTITYHMIAWITLDEFKLGYFPDVQIDSQTGKFWFLPCQDDVPSRDFSFIAKDHLGACDSTKFTVTVN